MPRRVLYRLTEYDNIVKWLVPQNCLKMPFLLQDSDGRAVSLELLIRLDFTKQESTSSRIFQMVTPGCHLCWLRRSRTKGGLFFSIITGFVSKFPGEQLSPLSYHGVVMATLRRCVGWWAVGRSWVPG